MARKINTKLKRAYYYFGFEEVVSYNTVKLNIEFLKEKTNDEFILIKINGYADEIDEFFDTPEKREDIGFSANFAKEEPRRSWEHYSDDFPEDIFESKSPFDADKIEPFEDIYSIEPIEESSVDLEPKSNKTKIYLNCEHLGYCDDPVEFTHEMREKRRNGKVSSEMNITYYEDSNEIHIFNDSGRARRPLIIVENGVPRLKENHLVRIINGSWNWDDLINNGIIEFLDAEEEENSYIAINLANLTGEHTHLEIDPATMLGICAGIIPFSNHNSSPRNTVGAGMTKQALGFYASNYTMRTDTRAHLLHYLQNPIVKTRIIDSINYDLRPSGQNFVVALMSYEGYNMEDGMVFNKASLERGLGRSSFFRAYDTSEKRYAGGQVDKFEVPDKNIKGYRSEDAYRNLDEDGVVNPESYVESGDVLIGKTSPPRFLEEDFGTVADMRRETSVTVRHGEKGIVDAVLLSETVEGSRLAKIRVRDTRQPELGDKFASRHGQKGVIGLIVDSEDMPFTEFGVVPDLIVNPHAFPSRMSIGHIFEMIAGKVGSLEGKRVDGTPFDSIVEDEIKQHLIDNGFESAGCESLYDGVTGERFEAEIFVGVAYYQKLHHMTTDKVYARSNGPIQVLTRQPIEGRAREGGLRFGEMEKDALIAHGAAISLKERLLDESDKYEAIVCDNCGMLAVLARNRNKIYCPICGEVETYPVEISYAFKLLLDELKSLCVYPKLILGDKTDIKKPFKRKSSFKPKPLEDKNTLITKTRLADEEPLQYESVTDERFENCVVCGKKLNKNQKNLCRICARKQYASRIIKKLSTVVKPGIPFKKGDLKPLKLADLQIKDYIWTLQEFDLIDVDNNKFILKNEEVLNDFRVKSGFDPIDFENIDGLDKTCNICGKTLPLSKFYKTSEGYEDVCKDCKRLITTANYLNDIISFIGFDEEFTENDLKNYISNPNQTMGIIWALQDQDLLSRTGSDSYILSDESQCLNFVGKYLDKSKLQYMQHQKKTGEIIKSNNVKSSKMIVEKEESVSNNKNMNKSIYKNKVRNKSRVNGGLGKSNILSNVNIGESEPKQDSKLVNDKKKCMKIVLDARNDGKTREEAAKIAKIPLYRLNHWYREGRQGFGKENIEFYKQLKKIEKNLFDSSDSNERKHMEFVLKLLRQGKSKKEVAKFTNLNESTLTSWYNQGREKRNINTIYFYNEVQKIKNNKPKSTSKRNNPSGIDIESRVPPNRKKVEILLEYPTGEIKKVTVPERTKSALFYYYPKTKAYRGRCLHYYKRNKTHKSKSKNKHADSLSYNDKSEIESNKIKAKELKIKIKEFIPKFVELDEKIANINAKNEGIKSIRKEIKSNVKILKQSSRLRRLDRLENRLSNAKKSYNVLKIKVDNFPIDAQTFDNDELIKEKQGNNKKDLLKVLYSITGSNNVNFKASFISCLKSNDIPIKKGTVIKNILENEINNNVLTTPDEIKFRFDELIMKKEFYNKDELLKVLYSITGNSSSPKVSYSSNLSILDCKKIRDALKNDINKGILKSPDKIKLRLDKLIKEKQLENNELLIEYLDSVVKKEKLKFSRNNLDKDDIDAIRNEVAEEIRSFELKTKNSVYSRFMKLLKKRNEEKSYILLDEFYEIVGEKTISDSFLEKLSDEGLGLSSGIFIKSVLEEKINEGSINNRENMNREINNLINDEIDRQNKSLDKLDSFYKNDNIYLRGFSSDEKNEIKESVKDSIKENRLDYLSVYQEFKKIIEEFKNKNVVEEIKDGAVESKDESSSGGFLSKLKGIFSSRK